MQGAAKPPTDRRSLRYRGDVAARVLAATLGGYGLVSLAIVTLSFVMPGNRARVVLGSSLLAFAAYAAVVMWVFSVRSALRAWVGLLAAALALAAMTWFFGAVT